MPITFQTTQDERKEIRMTLKAMGDNEERINQLLKLLDSTHAAAIARAKRKL